MNNILIIFRRELGAYFHSAIAYIFIIVFTLISGSLFLGQFFLISQATLRPFFDYLLVVLCVFMPAVTMRLWAEEKKGNTIELLLTFPMRVPELVMGKFLASLVFYAAVLASTLPISIMVVALGNPDIGTITCGYIGAFLVGAFFIALGLFVSGFCKDQIIAFVLSMLACFGFYFLGTAVITVTIDGWIPGLGSFLTNTLGLSQRYASFVRGVFDVSHLLYFVGGTAVFLILNGFWLEGKLRPKARTTFLTAAAICAAIFMLFNVILKGVGAGRFDMTQGQIYTISPGTGEILQGLDAPVLVKLYVSPLDKMPTGLKTLERDITDKLDEFQIAAKGNFRYKVFHLEAADVVGGGAGQGDTLEGSLLEKGVRPFQVRSIEADEVGVSLVYSAIAISYKDKPEEVIPSIAPDRLLGLEYALISKIHKMTLDAPPHAVLVAPYVEKEVEGAAAPTVLGALAPGSYREDNYRLLSLALQSEGYEVSRIRLSRKEPIPKDADALVIVEPEGLNDRQRFEINRFLVNGGSVFLSVQMFDFRYSPTPGGGLGASAERKLPRINQLIKNWGLEVEDRFLMDMQHEVVDAVSDNRLFGVLQMSTPAKLPVQIRLTPEGMNKDVSITSQIPFMLYMWGTALEIDTKKIAEANLELITLLRTTPESWTASYHEGFLTRSDFTPMAGMQSYPVAAYVKGTFPNVYEGRSVPEWPASGEGEEELPEGKTDISPAPGKLVVIGCSSIFQEQFIRAGGHARFFLNSIDTLTLGEQLVNIRGKQPIMRFIKRVSAGKKMAWRLFTTFLIPVILIVVGSLSVYFRRQSKSAYLKMLEGM